MGILGARLSSINCLRLPALFAPVIWIAILCSPASSATTDGVHTGVASCSSSTCHGRLLPNAHGVRQNEISTWQDERSPSGAHSRAWQVLGSARGQSIAARLGVGSAQSAPACIGCHLDNAAERGPKFQESDGIGC